MTIYDAMAARNPDFFLHSGDTVYADGPLQETVTLPDGRVWRNVVTPEKSKVAETLTEYRGQFAYNLLDENVRRFAAKVPQIVQWDDHEVTNNWYPGEILNDDRYTEQRADVLAARAYQAFHEWQPVRRQDAVDGRVYRKVSHGPLLDVFVIDMRTYRDPNSTGTDAGADPRRPPGALARGGAGSLPRDLEGHRLGHADRHRRARRATSSRVWPTASPARRTGARRSSRGCCSELSRRRVRNTVWLTADVHYSAALHYAPGAGRVRGLRPVLGVRLRPAARRRVRPERPGPDVRAGGRCSSAPRRAPTPRRLEGFQHFGEVNVDGETGQLRSTCATRRRLPLDQNAQGPLKITIGCCGAHHVRHHRLAAARPDDLVQPHHKRRVSLSSNTSTRCPICPPRWTTSRRCGTGSRT